MARQKSDNLVAQAVPQLAAEVLKRRAEHDARQGGVASSAPAATATVVPDEARAGWVRKTLQRLGGRR
jgi:hypothetical protein